jgi:hypothetical protein
MSPTMTAWRPRGRTLPATASVGPTGETRCTQREAGRCARAAETVEGRSETSVQTLNHRCMDCGEAMRLVRGGIRRMVIASTLVALALSLGACSLGGSRAPEPSRTQASLPARPTTSIRLVPVPDALIAACQRAQRRASHPFLCPSRLPRPYRHYLPLRPVAFGAAFLAHQAVVDVSYATDHGRGHPDEFLHFVVGRATEGVPGNARPARLGGRRGLLAPASSVSSYVGPYFANHVRFLWREHGVRYVATLHLFDSDERATEVLLDRILRTLRPAGELTRVRPGGPRATRIQVHPGPSELVLDASDPYVTSRGTDHAPGSRVTRIEAGALAASPLEAVPEQGVFVAAGEGALWAAGSSRSSDPDAFTPPRLVRIDPTSGRMLARRELGRDPLSAATGIVAGAGSVWVALTDFGDGDAGWVWRLDPLARGVIARLRETAERDGGGGELGVDGERRRRHHLSHRCRNEPCQDPPGRQPTRGAGRRCRIDLADPRRAAMVRACWRRNDRQLV